MLMPWNRSFPQPCYEGDGGNGGGGNGAVGGGGLGSMPGSFREAQEQERDFGVGASNGAVGTAGPGSGIGMFGEAEQGFESAQGPFGGLNATEQQAQTNTVSPAALAADANINPDPLCLVNSSFLNDGFVILSYLSGLLL